jgi:hypothetical protein
MEAQLQVKTVQVEATRQKLEHAKKDLDRAKALSAQRVLSSEEFERAQRRVDDLGYELKVKQAELLEPTLLHRQARRRIASLQGGQAEPDSPAEGRSTWGPHLFKKREHDFGVVDRGTRLTHKFFMYNWGKSPLRITGVRTSASFVTAVAKTQSLGPGQKGYVLVEVDTTRFTGPKSFKVFVEFEPPGKTNYEPLTTLTLKADSQDGVVPGAGNPKAATEGDRVRDLEQKIDRLLREMDDLRRELKTRQPQRSETGGPPRASLTPGDWVSPPQSMMIPICIDKTRKRDIARLILFSSRDEGRTWKQEAEALPSDERFTFHAREEGTYWLDVCTIDHRGNRFPSDPSGFSPSQRIQVESKKQ